MTPPGPYRLPGAGADGVLRRERGALERALYVGEECATVRAWPAAGAVRIRAEARSRRAAAHALERMRFALGVDHDLRPFQRRFAGDPLLGPVIRRVPWLRPHRRAQPFEALAWAITEQLIETERAWRIQRRLVRRYGPRSGCGRLSDVPSAGVLAGRGQAELQACDLSAARSLAMIRVSREVAAGRIDFDRHEESWSRLGRIAAIGPWTLEKLAFHGQGRDDQLPAGDLAYLKLVGRMARLGRRASVEEVRAFFAPYEPYSALAGIYLLRRGFLGIG